MDVSPFLLVGIRCFLSFAVSICWLEILCSGEDDSDVVVLVAIVVLALVEWHPLVFGPALCGFFCEEDFFLSSPTFVQICTFEGGGLPGIVVVEGAAKDLVGVEGFVGSIAMSGVLFLGKISVKGVFLFVASRLAGGSLEGWMCLRLTFWSCCISQVFSCCPIELGHFSIEGGLVGWFLLDGIHWELGFQVMGDRQNPFLWISGF
ncbi:hypothetical protein SUGI_0570870 [Cryptomeria japonica]|nr:hypothetical protein SUGI_0570870 [Cryptomeria japonica]